MQSVNRPRLLGDADSDGTVAGSGLDLVLRGVHDLARRVVDRGLVVLVVPQRRWAAEVDRELILGVITSKIVSKAEGRQIALADVAPGREAIALAEETDKDPRLVELILRESTELLRKRPGVLIMRHRLGFVGAHAGGKDLL